MTVAARLAGLNALTGEEKAAAWAALPQSEKDELIEYNDEHVRTWRATCQRCAKRLLGTRASIRAHKCDDAS